MIDFTKSIEELNTYKGSEKKKTLIYDNRRYLVKFPDPVREKNKNISYINNAFSEYVGSHIFSISGFETQNTILGTYTYNGKEKIVCACEDFTNANRKLYEFENLVLSANPDKKIETELSDIMDVIEEIKKMTQVDMTSNDDIRASFWDMFIVDALIGNSDRHNGNWGLIINARSSCAEFSPIYDCGSCLNPMYEDDELAKMSDTEIKNLAINCYSCIKEDGKKINYISYIKSCKNEECNEALKRIFERINIEKINDFIDGIECMSTVRRDFYKRIINYRYELIQNVYNKLNCPIMDDK
ncbi:MAG: HipA domain-containing protein [Clostridia bacterium]|nr:HipA domain-containing protein [Clostridia bacterium]